MHGFTRRSLVFLATTALGSPRLLMAASSGGERPTDPVETSNGKIRGLRVASGQAFRGIPYAADTGGRNRFMTPRPVATWAGVRDAYDFGARAPQGTGADRRPAAAGPSPRYGEDCCVLNVYTPSADRAARRPVLVFIHGGGFRGGSGDVPTLNGGPLARHGDVVVVTLNRRLNVLGFANLGLFDADFADAANAGQLDLVQALQWIRTNIANFGGDPGRVTIFGVSGGGSSVETLSIMPAAQGLFHRTLNMSGTSAFGMKTAADMAATTEVFLKTLGVDKTQIRTLQTLPPAQLLAAHNAAFRATGAGDYRPVVDGRHIPHAPLSKQALAIGGDIPGILSCTATEASAWLAPDRRNVGVTTDQVTRRIADQFGLSAGDAANVVTAYRQGDPARTPWDVLVTVATDTLTRTPMRRAAEIKAAAGLAPVYCSEFAWRSPTDGGIWGAAHSMDVPFAFGTLDTSPLTAAGGTDARAVMQAEMAALVAFGRSGKPDNPRMPSWKPYGADSRATMVIDTRCSLERDYRSADRRAAALLPDQDAFTIVNGPLLRYAA